jgi:hypothetical protein
MQPTQLQDVTRDEEVLAVSLELASKSWKVGLDDGKRKSPVVHGVDHAQPDGRLGEAIAVIGWGGVRGAAARPTGCVAGVGASSVLDLVGPSCGPFSITDAKALMPFRAVATARFRTSRGLSGRSRRGATKGAGAVAASRLSVSGAGAGRGWNASSGAAGFDMPTCAAGIDPVISAVAAVGVACCWIGAGVAVAALALFAYFYVPAYFNTWMGLVGGGVLVLTGYWLRRV